MNKAPRAIFLWHMHQPYYGVPGGDDDFVLPWVRLHGVKAYYDMAWMLERHPSIKAVVNFSGALVRQLREIVDDGRRDRFWGLTLADPRDLSLDEKRFVLAQFFSLHWDRLVRPHARYNELLTKRGFDAGTIDPLAFSVQELRDLQLLFNLQWCGFGAREDSAVVRALAAREHGFSEEDKTRLLDEHLRLLSELPGRWKALVERGQVEITATPMFHPILPLLIDSDVARVALPENPLPARFSWPDDADAHVRDGLREVREYFGVDVHGMWPAEGSVSDAAAAVFRKHDVRWIATDEQVLKRSDRASAPVTPEFLTPWRLETADGPLGILFRDHALSDLVGFSYAHSGPEAAANDLVGKIESAATAAGDGAVVPIVLDGENPWEAYADDGRPFLDALYTRLASSSVETALPAETLFEEASTLPTIHHLHPGSWISASFRIWIGVDEKNRGWELLGMARQFLAEAEASGDHSNDAIARAREAIYAAEGSDWFWWYGDDFSSANDEQFDRIFRRNCQQVYRALGAAPPDLMSEPISGPPPSLLFLEPRSFIHPEINGRSTYFYDWEGAGRYRPDGGAGAMYRTHQVVRSLHFGFDRKYLYLRFDIARDIDVSANSPLEVTIEVEPAEPDDVGPRSATIECAGAGSCDVSITPSGAMGGFARAEFVDCLELALPRQELALRPGALYLLDARVARRGVELDRIPVTGRLSVRVPGPEFSGWNWIV